MSVRQRGYGVDSILTLHQYVLLHLFVNFFDVHFFSKKKKNVCCWRRSSSSNWRAAWDRGSAPTSISSKPKVYSDRTLQHSLQMLAVLHYHSEFFDFMVLFNMRHLFFDFFRDFFFWPQCLLWAQFWIFLMVYCCLIFCTFRGVRFFSCFLFLKPSDPQIISLVIARHMSQHQKRNTSCCLMVCRIPVLLEGLHQPQMWFCCNPPSKCAGKDQTQDAIEHRCHCCWFVFWLHADSPLVEGCRKLADAWCLALHYCTAVFWDTKDIPSTVDFVHLNTV